MQQEKRASNYTTKNRPSKNVTRKKKIKTSENCAILNTTVIVRMDMQQSAGIAMTRLVILWEEKGVRVYCSVYKRWAHEKCGE